MAKRLGTVLVFKPGVNAAKAAAALRKLDDVLADDYFLGGHGGRSDPATFKLNEFDDERGGPVWYVP